MTPSSKLVLAACAVLVAAPTGPAAAAPRKPQARYMVLMRDRPEAPPLARVDARSGGNAEAAMRWQDSLRGESR